LLFFLLLFGFFFFFQGKIFGANFGLPTILPRQNELGQLEPSFLKARHTVGYK
jgi:hypothetical protein